MSIDPSYLRHVDAVPLSEAEALNVPGTLGKIVRERLADYKTASLLSAASPRLSRAHGFSAALRRPGLSVIAEVKRASPSLGAIADLEPVEAARAYRRGGAAALSILTEPRHFKGRLDDLRAVAADSPLPILRKDFTVHPIQLIEAAEAGASAVLLIVAVLRRQVATYIALAEHLGLDALVEVHDEAELELALEAGTDIIGVNNRNLKTLSIDLQTAPELIERARASGFEGLLVAESGYSRAEELAALQGLADAVLIGSSLAGSGDLEAALKALVGRRGK